MTHRIDSLLNGLGDGRLTDPLVATWISIAERFCKENNLIWHQDFPPEHSISELERLLTAIFIRHQSLGALVLAVVDRELSNSSGSDKLPAPVANVIRLVHQTKWTLIKTRQQLNRSYKEVCAPMLDKCRFLLYEVRPAISIEQCALNRLKILRKPPRFKSFVHRMIAEMRSAKKQLDGAKPEDILNVTIQSQCASFSAKMQQSNENLDAATVLERKSSSAENLFQMKIEEDENQVNASAPADPDNALKEQIAEIETVEEDGKTPTNDCEPGKRAPQAKLCDEQFINDVISKLTEKCLVSKLSGSAVNFSASTDARMTDAPKVMQMIVDFILLDTCDVETLRRAMYCQVQRYKIRKQGLEMFAQLLKVNNLLDAVQYNLLSGYLGLFLDKSKQHYLENVLDDLNMITSFQKVDLLLTQAKIIEWTIHQFQTFINQEQIFAKQKCHVATFGKDTSNLGTYVFLKKLPRARFLLSVFGILSKNVGPNEISLLINSGAISSALSLLRQTGTDTSSRKAPSELSYVYEDAVVKVSPNARSPPLSIPFINIYFARNAQSSI